MSASGSCSTMKTMVQTGTRPVVAGAGRSTPARRPATAPMPWAARLAGAVVAGGGVWVLVLSATSVTGVQLHGPGGVATLLGTACGLVGTYLAMIMVLLAGRVPLVERVLGLDGLLHWHRRLAAWPLLLIVAHVVLTTVGYAQAAHSGLGAEMRSLLLDYPDVMAATAGFALMVAIAVASIRAIRQRLRRETWWALHLYMYLALALAFAHAVVLGPTFVGHPITQAIWSVAWAATAGLVLVYRWALPLVRSLRHQLRVAEVRREGPDVVSVVLRGRDLNRLPVSGGQFVLWRFMRPGLWWQAHPYTLSALPQPPFLRITVKAVGDHSAALARLRPGTRVLMEGPYGVFTRQALQGGRVALLGAGIGVTAVRSLLEDLPRGTKPVVLLRATTKADMVLRKEVSELVGQLGGEVHELVGTRDAVRLDADELHRLVPDLVQRDVYVCGPQAFVGHVTGVCRGLGVPGRALHHEAYAL